MVPQRFRLLEVSIDPETASPEMLQLRTVMLEVTARHERLIDGLLMLARSEHPVLERSYVDLADIADHVATQVPTGTATIECDLAEAETTGEPVLLERLVQNLVENGVRYNLPDGGRVEVRTRTGPDGTAVLEVRNTGPVVPRYEIPGLFEPFRRASHDRLADGTHGAGLGLSIVRAITSAHGGQVCAQPGEGGGLVVTVVLPGAAQPPSL
jgi:signal transduction histidine kinase